jgi:hypothetical protein
VKCYVVLIFISCVYGTYAMEEKEKASVGDIVINVQQFIDGNDKNKYKEGPVQIVSAEILDNDTKYQCNTLDDVRQFLQDNATSHEITAEYIKQYVNIVPSVFVEQYMQQHMYSNTTAENTIKNTVFALMDNIKNNDTEKYVQHVLLLFQNYNRQSTDTLSFKRGKNAEQSIFGDTMKPLNMPSLEDVVAEELAKKNDNLQKRIISKECREKIYQASLVVMTLITAVIPVVQAFAGTHSLSPVGQIPFNCSGLV